MKYCRFDFEGHAHYGKVETRAGQLWIVDLAEPAEEDPRLQAGARKSCTSWSFDFEPMPLSVQRNCSAPVTPSKIVCVGRNYRDHAAELGNEVPAEPLLFFKPPSSLLASGGVVRMPVQSQRVDFEGELALVIGKRATKLKPGADWKGYIRGYTLANDVTARDLQKKDGPVDAWQGLRHVLPRGTDCERRDRPGRRGGPRDPGQRRAEAAGLNERLHLLHSGVAFLYHGSHYA